MMHPAFYHWWKTMRGAGGSGECGVWAGCGSGGGEASGWQAGYEAASDEGGGTFGVRRPLRFLAYKLQLNESQVSELARVLSELKTERAQADVDGRRTVAGFADALLGANFNEAQAAQAAALRVQSAERLRDAVLKALARIHAILNEEQRAKLAYLIQTGAVTL